MIVKQLQLDNFRNYTALEIDLGPGVNVFFGNNGQGKTNLIEAIYMCACARSHRTAKDAELIFRDRYYYSIKLHYYSSFHSDSNEELEETVAINYKRLQTIGNNQFQRKLLKDGIELAKVADFVGNFHAVIFAPEDLQLVKDGPVVRRRFVDLLLSQMKPTYFKNLQDFVHILKQRNALLKNYKDKISHNPITENDIAQLDIWNKQYATKAALLIADRFQLLDKLSYYSSIFHENISGGKEKIRLVYKTIPGIEIDTTVENIIEIIVNRLKNQQTDDIYRGNTSTGPHRDDFDIFINDIPLKTFGSQGQQRTAVLAMKMSELEIIKNATKDTPVLLLDDVMSELDVHRRKQLVSSLKDTQIFITCTDPDQLDKDWLQDISNDSISYFQVEQGVVKPIKPANL